MLAYLLYGLFILSCIVLVVAVLLQPGKADAGAMFSSSISSTAFGPRGTQTLLAKITIGAAALFMLTALGLALPAITGSRSVLQGEPETATEQPAPAQPAANANQATQTVPVQPQQQEATQPATNANANVAAAPANTNATTNAPAASKNTNSQQRPPAKK